jgi:hypothetical protein
MNSSNPTHKNYITTITEALELGLKTANIVMLCLQNRNYGGKVAYTSKVLNLSCLENLIRYTYKTSLLLCETIFFCECHQLSYVAVNLQLLAPTLELRNMIWAVENTFVAVSLHIWRSWTLTISGKALNNSLRSESMLMVSGIVCSKMELDSFTESKTEKLCTYCSFKQMSFIMYS